MPGRVFRLLASVAVLLLAQGAARAAPLGWEGTLSLELLAANPSYQVEGGGVASVNASSGGLPGHLSTLRLAGSRHNLSLAETRLLTDPDVPVPTYFYWDAPKLGVTASLGTGTVSELSGARPALERCPCGASSGSGRWFRATPVGCPPRLR